MASSSLLVRSPIEFHRTWLRKIAFRFRGTFATTATIEVRGKRIRLTEESLRRATKTMIGTPIRMGHRGVTIGRVERAWYSDGKLQGIGAIFEPQNEAERKAVEQVRNGKITGLSPAISYDLPSPTRRRVVIHGSLKALRENEDGSLMIKGVISEDDLKRAGIDDLEHLKPNSIWLHNGSEEVKKKIEEDTQRKSAKKRERFKSAQNSQMGFIVN